MPAPGVSSRVTDVRDVVRIQDNDLPPAGVPVRQKAEVARISDRVVRRARTHAGQALSGQAEAASSQLRPGEVVELVVADQVDARQVRREGAQHRLRGPRGLALAHAGVATIDEVPQLHRKVYAIFGHPASDSIMHQTQGVAEVALLGAGEVRAIRAVRILDVADDAELTQLRPQRCTKSSVTPSPWRPPTECGQALGARSGWGRTSDIGR
mmetsp:Transcript_88377/g.191338  ORF Transcript_88377/g.191338 Transcript_88377/m.191338 type:complete len:211 (-) Transcript_88377:3-635(-)